MSHRYPWESTTYSTPQSKFKYSSPSSNLFSSTSNPYKRVTSFATTPATKYTYTTASYLYVNKYKTKVNISNDASYSKNGYAGGTTTRNYSYYTVSPISKINDLNYPKISPFRHKGTVSMVLATADEKDQNGPQNDARGKRNLYQKMTILAFFSSYENLLFIFSVDHLIKPYRLDIFFLSILALFYFSCFIFLIILYTMKLSILLLYIGVLPFLLCYFTLCIQPFIVIIVNE